MNTNATADTPANVPAPTTPELIVYTFDEEGVCIDPELVRIPMPKGFGCVLYLASDADGLWYFGFAASVYDDTVGTPCRRGEVARAFTARGDALAAALKVAFEFFEARPKTKKAVAALEFFAERNEIALPAFGSPANTPPDGSDTSGEAGAPVKGEFREIPVMKVQPNPQNHRKVFDEVALKELAESIRREGLLQPIAVREIELAELPGIAAAVPLCPEYEIILGERRWRAHVLLGAETISAKVYRGIDSGRAQVLALIENLQRVELNPIEEAEGYAALVEAGLTQEAIAGRVGRSRPVVANGLRLLKLPQAVLDYIRQGELTAAHGVALARFADWPRQLQVMADLAVKEQTTAGELEKGVPFAWMLVRENLAVSINDWDEVKVTGKLKDHPAYFPAGSGWICFDPPHWVAEAEARREQAKIVADKGKAKKEAELAKAAKNSKKALSLAELKNEDYRRFEDPAQEGLLELVPDDKKAVAKGYGDEGRVTIVTDVSLADKLKAAMQRAIKADRKSKLEDLATKVRKKIASLKKVGPREWGWLMYLITTYEGRGFGFNLEAEAAKAVGVKLPKEFAEGVGSHDGDVNDFFDEREDSKKAPRSVFEIFSTCEPVDLVKVLMEERLDKALESLVETGPSGVGARHLRWWLSTDTLWLLEESDDGRAELLEQVKNAPWYQALLAGDNAAGEGKGK